MLIFQKCFEGKEFDYKTFYTSQQNGGVKTQEQVGKEVISHLRNEVEKDKAASNNKGMNTPEGDGWANGPAPKEQPKTSQIGESNYNWKEQGISGKNSLWNQKHVEARRESAGLTTDKNGVDVVKDNVQFPFQKKEEKKDGFSIVRKLINEQKNAKDKAVKVQTKTTKPSNPVPEAFDEKTLRADLERQYHGHPHAQQFIDEQISSAKAQHDAEVTSKMMKNVKPEGIKVDTPKVEVKPEKIIHKDVPVIDDTLEVEDTPVLTQFQADRKQEAEKAAAELRANTGLVRGKAQEHLDDARSKTEDLKDKAVDTWNKLSENYGEGVTGSLGKDAALAAGSLALVGGAYHLLKKRRAKKKAAKDALDNKVKSN